MQSVGHLLVVHAISQSWNPHDPHINGHATGTDWLEVPIPYIRPIFSAYFLGLCKGISQQNMAKNMVQYLHFRILKFPLIIETVPGLTWFSVCLRHRYVGGGNWRPQIDWVDHSLEIGVDVFATTHRWKDRSCNISTHHPQGYAEFSKTRGLLSHKQSVTKLS